MRKTALKRIVSMSGDEGTGGCAPQPTEPDKRARRDNGSAVKASSIDPTPPAWCASGGCAPPPVEALSDEERPPLATGGSVPRPVVSVVLKGPPVPRALPGGRRGFVEVFAGCAAFTHVWQAAGHPVFPVDIKISPEHDFASAAAVELVWEVVQKMTRACGNKPPAVHLAPPCCTYSTARWPRLRSAAHTRGLPGGQLTPSQKSLVRHANKITKHAFVLMQRLADDGIPHTLEQPVGSLMLKDIAFRSWASRSGAQRAIIDQCQFGRPYRKRTAIWGAPSGLLDGLARTCPGDHVHTVTLSGWGSADRNEATNRGSSEYPEPLCQEWRRIMLRNLGDR